MEDMEKTLENIVLKRLCSALSDIVVDILKYCELDSGSRDAIISNILKINDIIQISSKSDIKEKSTVPPVKSIEESQTKRQSVRIAAAKRKDDEMSIVKSTQSSSKRGKIENKSKQKILTPVVSLEEEDDNGTSSTNNNLNNDEANSDSSGSLHTQIGPTSSDLEEELIALNPSKSIFISGFPSATTIKAINNHIAKKLPLLNVSDMEIVKNPVKGDYASFVLKTERNKTTYESLIERSFWPENTVVHRYDPNRKNNFFRGTKFKNIGKQH